MTSPSNPDDSKQPGRAADSAKQPFLGPWQAVTLLMVLLALLAALLLTISKFTASADVVAVLGVLVTPIVSLAAAAFGVTIAAEKAAQAGAAKGEAAASAAAAETKQADADLAAGHRELQYVRTEVEPLLEVLERVGVSRAGTRDFQLNIMEGSGATTVAEIPGSRVADIREHLARASEILGRRGQSR